MTNSSRTAVGIGIGIGITGACIGDSGVKKGGNLSEGRPGVLVERPALEHEVVDFGRTGGRPLEGQTVGETG